MAASRGAVSTCFRGTWRALLQGRQRQRTERPQTRKSLRKIPVRCGAGSLLVNSVHARIHVVKRRLGDGDD